MINLPAVKETAIDEEYMLDYYKTLLSGKEPCYDLGIPGLSEDEINVDIVESVESVELTNE